MNWREVEQVLVEIAKSHGLFVSDSSGHACVLAEATDGGMLHLPLTEIAKELVDRLGRKS